MMARTRARIIRITKIWVTTGPPPIMLPSASPMPVPSTMPGASIPSVPRTPWNEKGMRKKNTQQSRPE
jgi:hypothetical protein